MKYIDREGLLDRRLDGEEPRVQKLLEAMLANRRLFSADESDPPKVTDAIRFEQLPQKQRNPMDAPPTDGHAADVFELYEDQFDAPLSFQKKSWNVISEELRDLRRGTDVQGILATAPTGFGKTEAFMGPVMNYLSTSPQSGTAVFVYPRTALLRDQLKRVLHLMHRVKQVGKGSQLSCGVYYGDTPFYKEDVEDTNEFYNNYSNIFKLTDSWVDDGNGGTKPFYLNPGQKNNYLNVGQSDVSFSDKELILNRSSMVYQPPDIILTTLSSLENFSLKVNYNIVQSIDTIVFDEVHLYNGVYGSHAANIIRNLRELKREQGDSILFIGSSATLESPERFSKKMFGLNPEQTQVVEPTEVDYVDEEDVDEYENYYFLLEGDDVSLPSTYIQQSMLMGHSLLQPIDGGRKKMLSFIDSRSSVNQKAAQFRDADRNKQLWRHHLDTEEENWREVSEDMERDFIEEPLNLTIDHSDVELSSSDITGSDMLISTSSLEVGIDIGDLNVISQYHAPMDLSSFVQRAGRAGRDGDSSHIVTFLSQQEGDRNHFHRADRFLDSDVTTPLNPANPIIKWVHNSLLKYYRVSNQLDNPSQPGREFLKQYFTKDGFLSGDKNACQYPKFYDFLADPAEQVDDLLDSVPQQLFTSRPVASMSNDVEKYKSDLQAELKPLADVIGTSTEAIIHQADPGSKAVGNLQDAGFDALNQLQSRLHSLEDAYGESDVNQELLREVSRLREIEIEENGDKTAVQQTLDQLENFIEAFDDPDEDDEWDLLSRCRETRRALQAIDSFVGDAGNIFGGANPELSFDYGASEYEEFQDLLNAYRKGGINRMSDLQQNWKKAYYLGECLDELDSYFSTYGKSYESVYAVKYLLRSVYYFDRYLQMMGEEDAYDIWYVPEDYFGDAGTTFTLVTEDSAGETESSENPLFKITEQYFPYKSEFANNGSDIHVFHPRTVLRGDDVYFDLDETNDLSARSLGNGVYQPETISMDRIMDCSSGSGRGILAYCPDCYEILEGPSDECSRHTKRNFGTFYSNPIIDTQQEDTREDNHVADHLSIREFTMVVSMRAVELDIREARYSPSADAYIPKEEQPDPNEIKFPENNKLGFELETRGLIWELEDYVAEITENEAVASVYETHHKSSSMGFEEMCLHTAAHFLTVLVGDVTGVGLEKLLYDYDLGEKTVTVFERSEGGQGIVDLMADEVRGNPSNVLESLYRVGFDTSAIVEGLWADPKFVERLADEPLAQVTDRVIREAISEGSNWSAPDDVVRERVVQEVQYSLDRLIDIREEYRDTEDSQTEYNWLDLRQEIANRVNKGQSRHKICAAITVPPTVESNVENLLVKEHIDGCQNNLQIRTCTQENRDTSQSELLSYAVLRSLRSMVVDSDSNDNLDRNIGEAGVLPAKLDDDNFESLSF